MQAKTTAAAAYAGIDSMNTAMRALDSSTVSVVIRGLNYILVKSYEGETNPVLIDHHPKLLAKLTELLEIVNPLADFSFRNTKNDNQHQYYSILLGDNNSSKISDKEWKLDLPISSDVEYKYLAQNMDTNPVLQTILGIIRNLSFDLTNEVYVAYHTTLMKHIMSVVTASIYTTSSLECLQLAFDIISNVVTRIDFMGRKRNLTCTSFLDEFPTVITTPVMPPQYLNAAGMQMKHPHQPNPHQILAYQKELYKFRISKDMSMSSSAEYTAIIRNLLPILAAFLHESTIINRYYLLRALDVLQKVLMNNDNDFILQFTPAAFLERLALLLTVNFTRTESLAPDTFLITGDPLGRTRPPVSMILSTQQIVQSIQQQQQWQLQCQHNNNSSNNLLQASATAGALPSTQIYPPPAYPSYPSASLPGQSYGGMQYPTSIGNNNNMMMPPSSYPQQQQPQQSFQQQQQLQQQQQQQVATTATFFPLSIPPLGTVYSNTFLAEECDLEIRDLALDALVNLCRISLSNRVNLLSVPNIIPLLFRIANLTGAATNVSVSFPPFTGLPGNVNPLNANTTNRNEGSAKAVELLGYLMDIPEAAPYFHTIRTELMFAACSDDLLSDVLCNRALPSFIYSPPDFTPAPVSSTAANGTVDLSGSMSTSNLLQF